MHKIFKKSIKYMIFIMLALFICANNGYITVNAENMPSILNEDESLNDININDEFDDKSLIVVLEPSISQYSGVCYEFTELLHNVEKVESYEDLSELSVESLVSSGIDIKYYSSIEEHLNSIEFKQILKINLNTTSKEEVIEVIELIKNIEGVLSAEPNYIYDSADAAVDDPLFNNQWSLTDTYGIDVTEAWNFTTGSNNVRVGIIDSGISEHLDLNDNVVSGKDFYNDDYVTTDDIGGHGTSVAGIIGAVSDNGLGVAGINHNVTLVPLQTAYDTSSNGIHYFDDVIKAITYARDSWDDPTKRIHILNFSVGGFGYSWDVLAAIETYKGLFVWSAGNDGKELNSLWVFNNFSLDNLISVGAHDINGQRSIWNSSESSNYGNLVNIYAPSSCRTTSSVSNNSYRIFGGTSCAAPHVTGVAALLLSLNENLSAFQLKQCIIQSAEIINITLPDGSTQNVKKLNGYNAIKYALSHYGHATTLKYNTKYYSKSVDSASTFFDEKNYFLKLDVENAYVYDFTISSSDALEVTLYDSNFNKINISPLSSNEGLKKTFSYYLSNGTYFLQSNYISSSATGTINISIVGEPHTHSYVYEKTTSGHIAECTLCGYTTTLSHVYDKHYCVHCDEYTAEHDYDSNYEWISYTQHSAECICGEVTTQSHAVSSGSYNSGQRFATCLKCGGFVETGFVDWPLNSSLVNKVSINGSFILPNGIIVLEDEDIEAYINGTLVFYDKDKLPVIK